jgi:hypothetical protein
LTVGVIEGIAEATALIVKIFSGAISDFIGRRKDLLMLGYGLAALTKPLFPLASSAETAFTARFYLARSGHFHFAATAIGPIMRLPSSRGTSRPSFPGAKQSGAPRGIGSSGSLAFSPSAASRHGSLRTP